MQVHSRLAAVLSAAASRIRFTGYYDLWTSIYQYAVGIQSVAACPAYPYILHLLHAQKSQVMHLKNCKKRVDFFR